MPKDSIIFVTDPIDAIGYKPAIPAQIITAKPQAKPPTKDDWWTFELASDSVAVAFGKGTKLERGILNSETQ